MKKAHIIYELGLRGTKGVHNKSVVVLRTLLQAVRPKKVEAPAPLDVDSAERGERDPDGTDDDYDSDATDCSEIEGFSVRRKRHQAVS